MNSLRFNRFRTALAALLPLALGCSWARFDGILDNSPIQVLKAPKNLSALGKSVATMRGKSSTLALGTGAEGYAIYQFNKTDLESADALDQGSCGPGENCWLTDSVAAVGHDLTSGRAACFAFGIVTKPGEAGRALLYCEGDTQTALALPDPTPAEIAALTPRSKPPRIQFASGPRLAPDLLVGALPTSAVVWFYPAGTSSAVAVPTPPSAGISFGSSLAVAGVGALRFIVVGEPDADKLYVMRTDGNAAPDASLCISGTTNFATAITTGHFTAADSQDLAIASADEVAVLPALDQLTLSPDFGAPCVALSELGPRSLSCRALNSGNACDGLLSSAAFGASDLDADGRDELLVGAPSASTRGNDAAGKILLLSFGKEKPVLIEELSPSSTESGDRFGTSVVGVPMSRPEVVLAGAPGGNKLAAIFCTSLLAEGKGGVRCN
jgi:hypothetical protein